MKVSDLLEARRKNWQELERLSAMLEGGSRRKVSPRMATRFAALYRAVCADLALADAYQLPPGVIEYLHRLVGRAHNQLYRPRTFQLKTWTVILLRDVPRQLYHDNYLRVAFVVFWGIFVLSMYLAMHDSNFAERVVGAEQLMMMEDAYSDSITRGSLGADSWMTGFYVLNNAGIGLKCFAFGLIFGIGGLYVTCFNAAMLGASFGYMVNSPSRDNFFEFVTAHGPFELTAIVLSAAAGMRLGFALVRTNGQGRLASLRGESVRAVPIMAVAVIMFLAAALIEGFVSASALPYEVKLLLAVASAAILLVYFIALGFGGIDSDDTSDTVDRDERREDRFSDEVEADVSPWATTEEAA